MSRLIQDPDLGLSADSDQVQVGPVGPGRAGALIMAGGRAACDRRAEPSPRRVRGRRRPFAEVFGVNAVSSGSDDGPGPRRPPGPGPGAAARENLRPEGQMEG